MRNIVRVLAACSLSAMWGVAHAEYVLNGYQVPGTLLTSIWDVSDSGQLVGTAYDGAAQYAFVYDTGSVLRLDGPAGASSAHGIGISDTNVAVGNWYDGTGVSRPFVWAGGGYVLTDLSAAGLSGANARGISPDGRYLTGYDDAGGFVYDLSIGSLVATITREPGDFVIAQGINSFGQVVGSYTGSSGRGAFLYDLSTATRTDFSFTGIPRVSARGINDVGQIAGWLVDTDGRTKAWIGNTSGYQIVGADPAMDVVGEGLNNLGQVVGFYTDPSDGTQSPGFVSSPVVLPAAPDPGAPYVFTFSTPVVGDMPVFIDPLVAVGYAYAIGDGDPLFKSVSLPVGIGDNRFEVVIGGQRFEVQGNQIFDFTAHGFADGVASFVVEGIEPDQMLDPTDAQAFVTRLTFMTSGMFTGTQTALTADYTPPVPEPGTIMLWLCGLAVLVPRTYRRVH